MQFVASVSRMIVWSWTGGETKGRKERTNEWRNVKRITVALDTAGQSASGANRDAFLLLDGWSITNEKMRRYFIIQRLLRISFVDCEIRRFLGAPKIIWDSWEAFVLRAIFLIFFLLWYVPCQVGHWRPAISIAN